MKEIEPNLFFTVSEQELQEEENLFRLFANDLEQTSKANDLYAALCNNIWQGPEDRLSFSWRAAGGVVANLRNRLDLEKKDPELCQLCGRKTTEHYRKRYKSAISSFLEEKGKEPLYLEKLLCQEAGDDLFTPGYMGREDYLDFYCSGNEGLVAPWVAKKFSQAGYSLIPR